MTRLKSFVFEGFHGIMDQLKSLKEEIKISRSKKVCGLRWDIYNGIVPRCLPRCACSNACEHT